MAGTTNDNHDNLRPIPVGELLKRYPHGQRITGWDPANPPAVERAFRVGYQLGAARCSAGSLDAAADLTERLHRRRGDLYHGEANSGRARWSDRRAALLRGAMQGGLEMVRARAEGVHRGLIPWLKQLQTWASADPIQLDWSSACPPEPPAPDSATLGRDGVPRRLWGEVFGAMTMMEMLTAPMAQVRQRGPFMESKEQYERLRKAGLADLRARILAHPGEITGLEGLSQYEPDVQAVWRQALAIRAARSPGPVPTHIDRVPSGIPLGNIERILHPDPNVRRAASVTPVVAENQADRWPEPKAIEEFDCPDALSWIWQGWIAVAHITALVAKWKAGKTTLLHHLLCAREHGDDLAGAVTAGPTLVLSEEHPTLWRKRSVAKPIGAHVKFICLPLITSIRDWFEFTTHVTNLVVRDGYTLVVYDTLPGLAPIQDENANSQMLAILRPLLALKDVGTGTLLITHPPKGQTGDDFNVRGASALMGFADQLVALKRPEGDADSTQRILKCIGRLGEPLEQTIELRGSTYVTLGTQLDIERAGRRAALQGILPAEPPGLTVEEIIARWPEGEKAPTARTLRRNLADWLNKAGAGTKDDPARYWW